MDKKKQPGGMSAGLRKRQVKGRKHLRRVDVYFSPEEKIMVEQAAQRSGLSLSFYCVQAILAATENDLFPKFSPSSTPKNNL
jgi:hypothetical protein